MMDLVFAIAQVRAGLTVDFTPGQLASFNALLTAARFSFQL